MEQVINYFINNLLMFFKIHFYPIKMNCETTQLIYLYLSKQISLQLFDHIYFKYLDYGTILLVYQCYLMVIASQLYNLIHLIHLVCVHLYQELFRNKLGQIQTSFIHLTIVTVLAFYFITSDLLMSYFHNL